MLIGIGKHLGEQIANLRSYFQNQVESSLLYVAKIQADKAPPFKLKIWRKCTVTTKRTKKKWAIGWINCSVDDTCLSEKYFLRKSSLFHIIRISRADNDDAPHNLANKNYQSFISM